MKRYRSENWYMVKTEVIKPYLYTFVLIRKNELKSMDNNHKYHPARYNMQYVGQLLLLDKYQKIVVEICPLPRIRTFLTKIFHFKRQYIEVISEFKWTESLVIMKTLYIIQNSLDRARSSYCWNINTLFARIRIPILKIRISWESLMFIM